jgi:hypothetical protein
MSCGTFETEPETFDVHTSIGLRVVQRRLPDPILTQTEKVRFSAPFPFGAPRKSRDPNLLKNPRPHSPESETYSGTRLALLPTATRKMAFLPWACGEKKRVTSSS